MEKDGACKIDAVMLEIVSEGRIMLELIKKRKRNWLGHWLRRTAGCLRSYSKWEESSRQ